MARLYRRTDYCFEIYQARDGWRWRCCAGNHRIVADSGQSYTRKSHAIRAAMTLHEVASHAEIFVAPTTTGRKARATRKEPTR